jgi:hypothetical protein
MGGAIQRQSLWCAGLSCLSGSSNQPNEIGQGKQMSKTLATSREMVPGTFLFPGSLCASTLNHTHQNDHNRDDQEGMNESAHGIRGNKTQNPEDDQDDGNGLEHGVSPFAIR